MEQFQNILVGVDLSSSDRLVSNDRSPANMEAIDRSIWLAKNNSAQLTLHYAIDVGSAARRIIEAEASESDDLLERASEALAQFVEYAAKQNVTAAHSVSIGHSWLELIRKTRRDGHDLVIVGSQHHGALHGRLLGSTATKLLRKCPCPVWVTQSHHSGPIESILVAHCLRSVGDKAMELGCSLAQLQNAQLHVVHAVEFPEIDTAWPVHFPLDNIDEQRGQAEHHIQAQLAKYQWSKPPRIHLIDESPEEAVLWLVEKEGIQLVSMGTVARTGIAGFLMGNSAERILPRLSCSVIAVKPAGFVSPVEE